MMACLFEIGRLMENPVITCDGETYDYDAIVEWLADNETSPLTGVPLHDKKLRIKQKELEVGVPPDLP